MRSVLSVTSECAPLVKTGGLADVAGALPGALVAEGWQLRTLLPGYPAVIKALSSAKVGLTLDSFFGGSARVLTAKAAGLELLVLDAPHLFDRAGSLYLDEAGRDFDDNPQRFAALSQTAAAIAQGAVKGFRPEVVHCHDWQAGLAPYYLRDTPVGTVFTIHNIAFQGVAPAQMVETLGIDRTDFIEEGLEYWGQISALKAGLRWADQLTTVSPTYAAELTTPEFGMGMEGLLRARERDLSGILNGVDTAAWNPATDKAITAYKTPKGKARNKIKLRKDFGLPETDGPLAVVVSRLSHQKGLDVLLDALPALVDRGGQLALLGTGDPALEAQFRKAAEHPNVAVHIGYDEALSHRVIAGGDAILIPSRFEPCGLTQLYGLRYGTIPVVARTGGLVDTVIDASPAARRAGVATGLQFGPVTPHALATALLRLVDLYHDTPTWAKMQKNAMTSEVGWDMSAGAYARLYEKVAQG
ncbi:MAG: glycogen synthase GlgA [Pseudomonadota bacterium]